MIQRLGDRITPPCHGRYLASHIAGARYFEQPGDHSLRFAASGDSDALYAEIADFLASSVHSRRSRPGAGHDPAVSRRPTRGQPQERAAGPLIRRHRGRLIKVTADGLQATFDAPGQAIRCAAAMLEGAERRKIERGHPHR